VVVVALATIAALPLFVFENPSSPGSFTGTAGAVGAPEVQTVEAQRLEVVELVVAAAPRFEPDVAGLSDRAQVWHLARSRRDTVARLAEVARHHEADALAAAGRPVRVIAVDAVNERVLGALMMHFMLETIIAAALFGVDPFDQPAVEDGKRRVRRYLDTMGQA